MAQLLTVAARRHIAALLRTLAGREGRLEGRFRAHLRQAGWNAAQIRACLAVTPAACARLGSLPRFLEQVHYTGRRLAKLNVPPNGLADALEQFGGLLEAALDGRHAPAREQLQLAIRLALHHAYYQVREGEAQAFFGLSHAAAEATDPDDLLRRVAGVLAQAMGASTGWLLRLEGGVPARLARPLYVECGAAAPNGADRAGGLRAYWSYPFGPSAVLQLGFSKPYPWLPRERALLAAAAERCQEALERVRLQGEIRRLEAETRRAEEDERRRIGRELHDEAGQAMMTLRLQLELLERLAPAALRPQLAEARELAGRTAVELRRIVAALSPAVLERLGLAAALRQLAARFQKLHAVSVRLRIRTGRRRLEGPVEAVIYRVTQECLHNVARHARASRVNLYLHIADKKIRLSVADNGAGLCADPGRGAATGFGLAGMRERAGLLGGTLAVRGAPGAGTRVILEVPLPAATVSSHGQDSHPVG